jgi:hypothetical protein
VREPPSKPIHSHRIQYSSGSIHADSAGGGSSDFGLNAVSSCVAVNLVSFFAKIEHGKNNTPLNLSPRLYSPKFTSVARRETRIPPGADISVNVELNPDKEVHNKSH